MAETATSKKYRKMAEESRKRAEGTDGAVRDYILRSADHYDRRAADLERKQDRRLAKKGIR
jgi:hypothetical protein